METKEQFSDLAILGGKPVFNEQLHVGRPNIGNRQHLLELVNDLLDRKWLSNNGPYVREFEKKIAGLVGVKHCISMCNGTIALEIAIRAMGLLGEVIVPSATFIATAHALQWQEITPVFADIDRNTGNIDPLKIERMITPRTSGIIGVHLWGNPCDVELLTEIAHKKGLKLLFDSAHAFACSHNEKMIGSFGNAEIFSFHATKFINTFEGGAVVTNDDDLAAKIRLMKNFGFQGYDNVIYIGTNGKMTEIAAAMGIVSLESLDEFIAINYRNYQQYKMMLEGIPGISLRTYNDGERLNYQYVVIEVDENMSALSRDQIIEILHKENILVRRYFYPGCHKMEPYRSFFPHSRLMLPNTEWLFNRVISFPTGTTISLDDIEKICNSLRFIVKHGAEIKKRLQ